MHYDKTFRTLLRTGIGLPCITDFSFINGCLNSLPLIIKLKRIWSTWQTTLSAQSEGLELKQILWA